MADSEKNYGIRHIAFIMDGNGRWAKARGMTRDAGHRAGVETFTRIVRYCGDLGIPVVTVYAFSTENWKRPKQEVDVIMKLIHKYLIEVVEEKIKTDNDFCVKFIGDLSIIPEPLKSKCIEIENMAKDRPFEVSVALNYGGRDEIVHAANAAHAAGHTELTEEILAKYMYTGTTPDPDLIIRTGGNFRISNFLLWQSAYSEYVVLDTLWPDFGDKEIMKSVREFYKRSRRFGGLDKEDTKKK